MASPARPPQLPEEFGALTSLGHAQSVHTASAANRWISAIFGALLIAAAGIAAVYGLYDTGLQVARYGPVMFSKTIFAPLIIAAVLLLIGALALNNAYQNWNRAAVLYEQGLGYTDRHGLQTWAWSEVELLTSCITKHYHNGIYTGTTYLYSLQKANGVRLCLDNRLQQIESLGRVLSQKTFPYQYNRLQQQLRSGQSVALGPIVLSTQGLTLSQKFYAWDVIESVSLQKGYLSFKKKAGGLFRTSSLPAASIPNLDAALSLMEQYIKPG